MANDDSGDLDQAGCHGSGERWSDNEFVVKVEPRSVVNRSFVR